MKNAKRRAWNRFSPESFRKRMAPSTPWLWTSSIQNGERINFCSFKLRSFGEFVGAVVLFLFLFSFLFFFFLAEVVQFYSPRLEYRPTEQGSRSFLFCSPSTRIFLGTSWSINVCRIKDTFSSLPTFSPSRLHPLSWFHLCQTLSHLPLYPRLSPKLWLPTCPSIIWMSHSHLKLTKSKPHTHICHTQYSYNNTLKIQIWSCHTPAKNPSIVSHNF